MKKVTINKNDAAQRLDKFITKYMPRLPQGMLYKGLRKNCVRVNGKHVKDGKFVLSEGDELTLYFADEFFDGESSFTKGRSDIDVVYEDENIILINKPA
ncbi:MAG: RluA family pseudouridine synthase, partial [Clostridia bacterium]|nr:RluA family pseudouridine synthase [Clostridia bacterium]